MPFQLKSALKDGIVNYFSWAAFYFTKDHPKFDFETFQKFIERSKEIDLSGVNATTHFYATEVAADPAWFNDVLSLNILSPPYFL